MSIPYRHRRILNRLGVAALFLLLVFLVVWLCWVVWIQRFVVYTSSGAKLDFSQSSYEISGVEAAPPAANVDVSIFYNEGADAIDTTKEMTQLSGYYITSDMYKENLSDVMLQIERLPNNTPIMVDMKGPFGTFFYNSKLNEAVPSQSTDIPAVAQLLDRINKKGFYKIARISTLRDRTFGENHVSSGLYMLAAQAKRSAELFTGIPMDDSEIARVTQILRRQMLNIILVGMPGSGKTTVSQALGKRLGRKIIDTDAQIEARVGMSVPDIFAKCGEAHFRALETEVLREVGKQSGKIIATGGGCVTQAENFPLLRQNGIIVWLERDVALLARDSRPLSQSGDLRQMYETRRPCYERFADVRVDNNGPLEDTVTQILEVLA